jgi:amicoumacin kinase
MKSTHDRLLEIFVKDENKYCISVVSKAQGILAEELSPDEWSDSLFHNIGRAAGKIHSLAKRYQPSSQTIRRPAWQDQFREYISGELLVEGEQIVKDKLAAILREVESFPQDVKSYGLIHADLHFANFYVDGVNATIFDFEDCCYGWFTMDAAMALFDILVLYPGKDVALFAEKFMTCYLRGYLSENDLALDWIKRLPDFLKLQEIFIYSMVYRFEHPDEWCTKFLENRKYRIENDVPYVDIDFEAMWNIARQ